MLLNQQQSAREALRRYVIISTTFPLPTSRFPSQPRPPHRSCSCSTTSPPAVPPPLGEGDGDVCFNPNCSPHPPARHRVANARLLARPSYKDRRPLLPNAPRQTGTSPHLSLRARASASRQAPIPVPECLGWRFGSPTRPAASASATCPSGAGTGPSLSPSPHALGTLARL